MPAYYNDNNAFACRVLRKQIAAGTIPEGTVDERSITDLSAADVVSYAQVHLFAGIGGLPYGLRLAGIPDDFSIWTGGFPCQDLSFAGQGAGLAGARSGLWSEIVRLLRAVGDMGPDYLLLENVQALRHRGLGTVLSDLAACGYAAEWQCFPASAVGAPHQRDRIWIVAYPEGQRCRSGRARRSAASGARQSQPERALQSLADSVGQRLAIRPCIGSDPQPQLTPSQRGNDANHVADAECNGWQQGPQVFRGRESFLAASREIGGEFWATEPGICGVANGVPGRVDRLTALGNAVVPQAVAVVGRAILAHAAAQRFTEYSPEVATP